MGWFGGLHGCCWRSVAVEVLRMREPSNVMDFESWRERRRWEANNPRVPCRTFF